jgi:hypothetical protein
MLEFNLISSQLIRSDTLHEVHLYEYCVYDFVVKGNYDDALCFNCESNMSHHKFATMCYL